MKKEVFIKNVELTNKSKAIIKSRWISEEDRLELEIFERETLNVYIGSCEQKVLRKKKDINIDFETIKDSITSAEVRENISFELNTERLKFSVIAQDVSDSDSSFVEIIYLKVDLERISSENILKLTINILDEMSESQQQKIKLETDLNRSLRDLKETSQRYQQMNDQKTEYEKTVHHKFLEIINSKKQRIIDLEKKLERSKRDDNKFKNLSSDFDQSDLSIQEAKAKTPSKRKTPSKSKPEFVGSSSDDAEPSTSNYMSPARSKQSSKNNTPRSSKPHQHSRSSRLSSRSMFDFKNSDDSEDSIDKLLKTPKSSMVRANVETPEQSNKFTNFSIKITQKIDDDDLNQSSAELFIPKLDAAVSSSPENRSNSASPEFAELAQEMDCDIVKKTDRDCNSNGEGLLQDEIFTQRMEFPDDDEFVENSQPSLDSPSIFDSYSKRKQTFTPKSTKRTRIEPKKSSFSAETIDILAHFSP